MRAIDMMDSHDAARDRNVRLENFAAALTSAAYPFLLRRGLKDSWLEVELGLWRALVETVKKWARQRPPAADADELEAWQEELLVELTGTALDSALQSGIEAPLPNVQRGLSTAFRLVIGRFSHVS